MSFSSYLQASWQVFVISGNYNQCMYAGEYDLELLWTVVLSSCELIQSVVDRVYQRYIFNLFSRIHIQTDDYFMALVLFAMLLLAYVIWYFGDKIMQRFDSFNIVINQTVWYEYPIKTQKRLLNLQPIAQRPVRIVGYPNLGFDHLFFQRVLQPQIWLFHFVYFCPISQYFFYFHILYILFTILLQFINASYSYFNLMRSSSSF